MNRDRSLCHLPPPSSVPPLKKEKKKNPNWKRFESQRVHLAPTLLFYGGEGVGVKSRGPASPDPQPNLQDQTRLGSGPHERETLARRRELGTSGCGRPGARISKTGERGEY